MRELSCQGLPHPIGKNRTHGIGRGRVFTSRRQEQWAQQGMLCLRAAGFRRQPPGAYWLSIDITLFTRALDCDAPTAAIVDLVAKALAIDDRAVGRLTVSKVIVSSHGDQAADVRVSGGFAPTPEDFNRHSLACLDPSRACVDHGSNGVRTP